MQNTTSIFSYNSGKIMSIGSFWRKISKKVSVEFSEGKYNYLNIPSDVSLYYLSIETINLGLYTSSQCLTRIMLMIKISKMT